MQKSLLLRGPNKDISDTIIQKVPNFKGALKLSKEMSGLTDLQLCQELEIDPGHWSRIWSDKAHFPDEKIIDFMNLCENIVPVRWLALQYGYELRPIKSKLEAENDLLREEIEQLKQDFSAIKGFLKDVGINAR